VQIYLPIADIPINIFLLLGMGLAVGFVSGMFGIGGGFLLTPFLIFIGITPAVAVATVTSHIAASSFSGALSYWRKRAVDPALALVLLAGALIGTGAGVWLFGLLRRLGQLDLMIDRPAPPDGQTVRTRADEIRLGLDSVVASYILPENMVWWRLDRAGRYLECLIREVHDEGRIAWRHWDERTWTLYDEKGEIVKGPVEHGYGLVPIVRVFDRRRPRCRNIGLPRYESIAEIQREFYNRDSELILSDTTQAHPLLQGPEDYVKADGAVPIGPNWLLPKKKNAQGGSATYEGFDVITFPKAGAESLRLNKADLRDSADRAALLLKPAGSAGTGGSTVGQSGVSKRIDQAAGNDLLSKVAATLGQAERRLSDLALVVMNGGEAPAAEREAVRIQYPTSFDLFTGEELGRTMSQFQTILAAAGNAPRTEGEMLAKLVRAMLPGLDDADYRVFDAEIDRYLGNDAGADRDAP